MGVFSKGCMQGCGESLESLQNIESIQKGKKNEKETFCIGIECSIGF